MVKFVVFEESFRDRCVRVPYFSYGLILGHTLKEEECLFLPIEAPSRSDNIEQNEKPLKTPTNISEIDEKWVAKHCKNIIRMIPGGVRISGLFVTATSDEVSEAHEFILRILAAITSTRKSFAKGLISNDHSEKILLYVDPQNKTLHCKSVDLDDNRDTLRTVEIRIKQILSMFQAVKTSVSLSFDAYLPPDRKKEKILKRLEVACEPFLRSLVFDTDILVCNNLLSDSDLLFTSNAEGLSCNIKHSKSKLRIKHDLIDTSDTSSDYWSPLSFVFYGPHNQYSFRACSTSSSESGASSDTGFTSSSASLFQKSNSSRPSLASNRQRGLSSSNLFSNGQRSAAGASPVKGNAHSLRTQQQEVQDGFRSADEELTSDSYFGGLDQSNQRISIHGIIPGIAFLPIQTTTVYDVKQAFREDLVRSTLSRLELLSEALHITSGVFEVPKMYLPQRVLVRLPACRQLPLSDYKFCSETPDDVVERLIYLCLPLGSTTNNSDLNSRSAGVLFGSGMEHFHGDGVLKKLSSLSSLHGGSDSGLDLGATPDSTNQSLVDDPEIAIDASCLDVRLEYSPENNHEPELSERELLEGIDESIKKVAKYSRTHVVLALSSLLVLTICLVLPYLFFGSSSSQI